MVRLFEDSGIIVSGITTLNEDENLAVDFDFQEYAAGGKADVDFGTGHNRMHQRTKDILHVSNELKKLSDQSESISLIIDWTGENLIVVCPEKKIELNFTLHHSNGVDADGSMVKKMGKCNNDIDYILQRKDDIPELPAAEWLHHPEWKVNRDLRQGGVISYPEIIHSEDFVPAFLSNYEAIFSAKAVAHVGNGDPMLGAKVLSFLNTYWSQKYD